MLRIKLFVLDAPSAAKAEFIAKGFYVRPEGRTLQGLMLAAARTFKVLMLAAARDLPSRS